MKPKADDEGTTPAVRPGAVSGFLRVRMSRVMQAVLPGVLAASPALASENLNLQPDIPILVVLIFAFIVLILPANLLIFKPIFRALDERKARIEGARSRAKQIERDADHVLADYEARIREARAEADSARKEQIGEARNEHAALTASARGEAETQIERARQTLEGDLVSARESMRAGARELAQTAAEQILGRSIS